MNLNELDFLVFETITNLINPVENILSWNNPYYEDSFCLIWAQYNLMTYNVYFYIDEFVILESYRKSYKVCMFMYGT
jgi:hypothetical protein